MIYEVSSGKVSIRATAVYLEKNYNNFKSIYLTKLPCSLPQRHCSTYIKTELPEARRTKGGDRSPMFIPSVSSSTLLQHQINEVRPLGLPEHPVVVAVVPILNLVNVRGKEAVQGMSRKISSMFQSKSKASPDDNEDQVGVDDIVQLVLV